MQIYFCCKNIQMIKNQFVSKANCNNVNLMLSMLQCCNK